MNLGDPDRVRPEHVTIFDTTLRDGEQSPGCSMNVKEKVRMAYQLDRLGVDIIEAGFPIASEGDFDAVRALAREIRRPVKELDRDVDRLNVFCVFSEQVQSGDPTKPPAKRCADRLRFLRQLVLINGVKHVGHRER